MAEKLVVLDIETKIWKFPTPVIVIVFPDIVAMVASLVEYEITVVLVSVLVVGILLAIGIISEYDCPYTHFWADNVVVGKLLIVGMACIV